ncbi:MAG TPA: SDR family oxidoreductase [Gammaproteobacteria bacterium]|nr:SDR family oxidoreductase [Gammaproteobacteria bacterium]
MTKLLVITGGSRGIGKAAIQKFMKNKWSVVNLSRTPCDIDGVTNINVDLSDAKSLQQQLPAIKKASENCSEICLVHNASVFAQDDSLTLDENEFRNILEFNLVSTVTLNKLFIPMMHKGSSIIFIGSTLSEIAVAGRASYVISKHALIGVMRAICQDLRGKDITTCCICPGFVNTSMLTDQVEKHILDQQVKELVSAGRLIEPEEIADLIFFCAEHPVINGSVLHANLGQINS